MHLILSALITLTFFSACTPEERGSFSESAEILWMEAKAKDSEAYRQHLETEIMRNRMAQSMTARSQEAVTVVVAAEEDAGQAGPRKRKEQSSRAVSCSSSAGDKLTLKGNCEGEVSYRVVCSRKEDLVPLRQEKEEYKRAGCKAH